MRLRPHGTGRALRAREAGRLLRAGAEGGTASPAGAALRDAREAARDAERRRAVAPADRIAAEVAARAGELPA